MCLCLTVSQAPDWPLHSDLDHRTFRRWTTAITTSNGRHGAVRPSSTLNTRPRKSSPLQNCCPTSPSFGPSSALTSRSTSPPTPSPSSNIRNQHADGRRRPHSSTIPKSRPFSPTIYFFGLFKTTPPISHPFHPQLKHHQPYHHHHTLCPRLRPADGAIVGFSTPRYRLLTL